MKDFSWFLHSHCLGWVRREPLLSALQAERSKETATVPMQDKICYHQGSRADTSIHAVEIMDITAALGWVTSVKIKEVGIYSDSLGVLQAIEQILSFPRPNLLADFSRNVQSRPTGCFYIRLDTRASAHEGKQKGRRAHQISA